MARQIEVSEGLAYSTPPALILTKASGLQAYANDAAFLAALGRAPTGGDTYYNLTTQMLRVYRTSDFESVYIGDLASYTDTRADARIALQKGAASGLATLDGTSKVSMSQMPSAMLGASIYQGAWDASANSPALTSSTGTKGWYYVVTTPGATNLDGITDWKLGDWAIFNGTIWQKVDNTDAVISVNGVTGAVVLTTTNISEGTNLYYTEARVSANATVASNATKLSGITTAVGTTETQTLTNKTISTANNTIQSGSATVGQVFTANGSGGTSWTSPATAPANFTALDNLGVAASVASSALTIALKDYAGADPTAVSSVRIGFRGTPITSGLFVNRSVTAALSLVVPSGATLGHQSATARYLFVYAIDNAGTVELAVSSAPLDESQLQSTTAISAAATSNTGIYSTVARTNVAVRMIARLTSTQTTAGTWAAVPSHILLAPRQVDGGVPPIVARYYRTSGQTINNTDPVIDYNTKSFDPYGCVTTGASWRFNPIKAGVFKMSGGFGFTSPGVATAELAFRKTGTRISYHPFVTPASGPVAVRFIDYFDLALTDYLHASGFCGTSVTSGGSLTDVMVIEYVGQP